MSGETLMGWAETSSKEIAVTKDLWDNSEFKQGQDSFKFPHSRSADHVEYVELSSEILGYHALEVWLN